MGGGQEPDSPEKRPHGNLLRKIAIGILSLGLSVAALVFVMAPAELEDEYSEARVASVSNSKKYRLELERIGGKAAVVAAEFNEWFTGLWHGRRLAGTLAVLSIGASLLCLLAARLPPPDG